MTHLQTYQQNALRTEKPLATPFARMEHAILGLITEVGEITTEIKRMEIYEKPLDDDRRKHLAEEIGDVLWYLAIASDAIGTDIFSLPENVPEDGFASVSFTHIAFSLAETNGDLIAELMTDRPQDALLEEHLLVSYATLMALAFKIGVTMDQIAGDNIAKLRDRFPGAYSNEAAEARADKGGLDARNS